MATKCKQVVDSLLAAGVVNPSDHQRLEQPKHLTATKATATAETTGWPSGKSLWDHCVKVRLKI